MSAASRPPSVPCVQATAVTRVAPDAFRRAEVVRGVGLALTGALSVLGGLLLATVAVAVYVAIGPAGEGVGAFLPGLVVMAVLAGYLAVAPSEFAWLTRATTARETLWWLAAALVGHGVGWAMVAVVVGA